MTIDDDDTLKQLLRINDELLQPCKFLNEKRDMETSSRLIPLVDDLTHISDRSGQEQITLMMQPYKGYFIDGCAGRLENRTFSLRRLDCSKKKVNDR
jgi:hypothetical protein